MSKRDLKSPLPRLVAERVLAALPAPETLSPLNKDAVGKIKERLGFALPTS